MSTENLSSTPVKPKNWAWIHIPSALIGATLVVVGIGGFKEFFKETPQLVVVLVFTAVIAVLGFVFLIYVRKLNRYFKTGEYSKALPVLEVSAYLLICLGVSQVINQFLVMQRFKEMHPNAETNWIGLAMFIAFFALMAYLCVRLIKIRRGISAEVND